jgi:hypothetical protein
VDHADVVVLDVESPGRVVWALLESLVSLDKPEISNPFAAGVVVVSFVSFAENI